MLNFQRPPVAGKEKTDRQPGSSGAAVGRPVPIVDPAGHGGGGGPVAIVGNFSSGGGPVRQPPTISPQQQKQVDRLTWQDLDADFPHHKKTTGNSSDAAAAAAVLDDSSDFESPLLLKRTLPQMRTTAVVAAIPDSPAAIEDFSSPPLYPGNKADSLLKSTSEKVKTKNVVAVDSGEKAKNGGTGSGGGVKTLKQKAENRWGLHVEEITASQRKRLKKQKQSRIDGFFKNPPPAAATSGGGIKKRLPAGVDEAAVVERVLKESREEFEKEILQRRERNGLPAVIAQVGWGGGGGGGIGELDKFRA